MSAELAVRIFKQLKSEDIRVLTAIELGMASHRYVPEGEVFRLSELTEDAAIFHLKRLYAQGLIRRWVGPYVGYVLNMSGYDCLAINALVKAGILQAFGKPLGVGKEADVYDALSPSGEQVAVKFHRLGRTSFRQTKRARGYVAEREHISWLYQSRLAAEREYQALQITYPCGVSVPKPIGQNRHVVVMGFIEGIELAECIEISNPATILDEILSNIRKAYVKAGIIHADLSEFNVILKPDEHILIIDWPQFVTKDHPNATMLLERDVRNIIRYFCRKFGVEKEVDASLRYVKGEM
jgi:RIO kinase 2